MAVEHNTITDPNLHEPKGASAASVGTILQADGTGATSWSHPQENSLIAYGHLYTRISDAATLATIGTTPATVTFAHAGVSNKMTLNQASGSATVLLDGVYEIAYSMSLSTVAAGDSGTYIVKVNVNGTPIFLEGELFLSGTSDNTTMCFSGLSALTANDVIFPTVSKGTN